MKNINFIVNQLYDLEKEIDKYASKGVKKLVEFSNETIHKRNALISEVDRLLDEKITFSEPQFKCFWQSGLFGKWSLCDTKDKYINLIRKYLTLYGRPLDRDTIMYKAVYNNQELFGSSWTKDWKCAFNFATKFNSDTIISMNIPKGTKTIHFYPTFRFNESEDLLDTTNAINETLYTFAELKRRIIDINKGIFIGVFAKLDNGSEYYHKLDSMDSWTALAYTMKLSA